MIWRAHRQAKGCLRFILLAHHVICHAQMELDLRVVREIPGAFLQQSYSLL